MLEYYTDLRQVAQGQAVAGALASSTTREGRGPLKAAEAAHDYSCSLLASPLLPAFI